MRERAALRERSIDHILRNYQVDLSDMTDWSYRLVNRHGFWLAVTCVELAQRIVSASDRQAEAAEYIKDHLSGRYAGDPGYLEGKAVFMRTLSAEVDVCREMLRTAIEGFKPNNEGN